MLADEEQPIRHGRGRAGGKLIARPADQVHTGLTHPSEYGGRGKAESGAAISLDERVLTRWRDGMHSNTHMTTRDGEVKEIGPTRTGSGGPEQQMEVQDKKGVGDYKKAKGPNGQPGRIMSRQLRDVSMGTALGRIELTRRRGSEFRSKSAGSPADHSRMRGRNRMGLGDDTAWHIGKSEEIGPEGIDEGRSGKWVDPHKQEGKWQGKGSEDIRPGYTAQNAHRGGVGGTLMRTASGRKVSEAEGGIGEGGRRIGGDSVLAHASMEKDWKK